MAVFNATANQYIAQPVTAYYEGKRKRAVLKQAEADLEYTNLRSKDLKQALEGGEDEKAKLELEELRLNVQKKRDELGDAEMQRRADAYGPILEEATKMSEAGKLEEAIDFANKELRLAAEKLGPEILQEFIEGLGSDRMLDKEEISRIKYGISAYYEMAEADKADAAHVNMYNPETGERIAVRPDSPEADEAAANGFLVGGTSKEMLGLDEDSLAGDLKAADESYILRMVSQHFGGLKDEATGMWTILDPTKRRMASQVTEAAAVHLLSGAAKTRSTAVKMGMKAYDQKWEEPKDSSVEGFDIEAAAQELNVTVQDLQFTASKRGMSAEEVYQSLKNK